MNRQRRGTELHRGTPHEHIEAPVTNCVDKTVKRDLRRHCSPCTRVSPNSVFAQTDRGIPMRMDKLTRLRHASTDRQE